MKFKIVVALFLTIFLFSCNKENVITITINTPEEGAIFNKNDVVNISGNIEASSRKIVEYTIHLKNISSGEDEIMESFDANSKSITVGKVWQNDVTMHSDMMLIVSAKDKKSFVESDTTHFHCHPM